jgi:hypothetical protein
MIAPRVCSLALRSGMAGSRSIPALLLAMVITVVPVPASGAPFSRPHQQSIADPLVLAFYYTWFDENTWTYERLSDLPAQPYASRDRTAMGRHMEEAQAAGIDAFMVAWYGPGGDNQTEGNLAGLLDEAAARNFRIGVLFETDSPFFGSVQDVTAALRHLNSVHATHPAYLRFDGRPIVFFWRPGIYTVDTWRSVRAESDPDYRNVWISEGIDTAYLQVFDGHHLYSNTWNPPADLTATNQKFANLVASAAQQLGRPKLWIATVMPGYNDTRIRPAGFAHDRADGSYFAQSWQAAIASRPAWIVVNSFNEWPEGSHIEPSVAYGDQYIRLSATWSSTFKGTPGPAIQSASFAPATPEPTPLPAATEPTAYVNTALLNLRAGPSTDYGILGQVAQGASLPITGASPEWPGWWQVRYGADFAWVYGTLVATAGPMDQVAVMNDSEIPTMPETNAQVPDGEPVPLLLNPLRRPLTPYLSP